MEEEILQKLLRLTLAVYRLTDKFPGREILKSKIRGVALGMLEKLTLGDKNGIIANIQVLQKYFLIARRQQWVNTVNYDILDEAYRKLVSSFLLSVPAKPPRTISGLPTVESRKKKNLVSLNERQQKIVKIIDNSEEGATLGQMKRALGDIPRRTLIYDINKSIEAGILKRKGQGRGIFYVLKK